jgi:hypothetical protein
MGKKTYSTFQACEALEIDYTRLNEWLRPPRGKKEPLFKPHTRAKGRGTRTQFVLTDLYRLMVFKLLVESGIARWLAGEIVSKLRKMPEEVWNSQYINVGKRLGGDTILVTYSDGEPQDLSSATLTNDKGKIVKSFIPNQVTVALRVIKKLVDNKLP